MRARLTDLSVAAMKSDKQEVWWDELTPGFAIRVNKRSKIFFVMVGKERRRVTIGAYPATTLKDAREKAKHLLLAKVLAPSAGVHAVVETYETTYLKEYRPGPRKEALRLLRKHLPDCKIAELSPSKLTAIMDDLAPSEANHLFGVTRTFLNWCERRDLIDVNPIRKLTKPNKEKSRTRVLSDDELTKVWKATDSVGGPFGTIVKLCILTGQRRGEIARFSPEWKANNCLVIPAAVTKNGKEHTIPLSPTALRYCADEEFQFNAWSKSKEKLDKLSEISAWTLHDLRRTCATNLARLRPEVIERILNHSAPQSLGGAIAAIYNRHQYREEMREALEKYDSWLLELVRARI